MKKLLLFLALVYLAGSCTMVSQDKYGRTVEKYRYSKDSFMKFSTESPLAGNERMPFIKLFYFDVDSSYKVLAQYEAAPSPIPIRIDNSGGDDEAYYKVGTLHFTLKGKPLSLSVYQNSEYMNNPKYKNDLFLPFWDASNGKTTYQGGRFIDVEYNGGNTVTLDFNYAYNPYCAYNHQYSCPIPPEENRIPFAVNAGEKEFEQKVSFN